MQFEFHHYHSSLHNPFAVNLDVLPEPAKSPNPKRILIVEDDEGTRYFFAKLLRREGFLVSEAVNGFDAMKQLAESLENFPDLLLMDLRMPGYDGEELVERVRSVYPQLSKDTHIVIASGLRNGREAAAQIGASGYLEKPVGIETLLSTIKKLLG